MVLGTIRHKGEHADARMQEWMLLAACLNRFSCHTSAKTNLVLTDATTVLCAMRAAAEMDE
jgi:hypothetical protein